MARFELAPEAIADLQSIWDYTVETWSEAQAYKYHRAIASACHKIAERPALGRPYDDMPVVLLGYRVEKHVIFYTIVAPGEVLIVRILHKSMDFGNWIEDEI